ncbi:MAG: hypothetical protein ACYC2H_07290 [Thermoplasmatota archaeon]
MRYILFLLLGLGAILVPGVIADDSINGGGLSAASYCANVQPFYNPPVVEIYYEDCRYWVHDEVDYVWDAPAYMQQCIHWHPEWCVNYVLDG